MLRFRSSKILIGSAVFASTFTDGFMYGIVSAVAANRRNRIGDRADSSQIVPVLPFSLVQRSGMAQDSIQFWTSMLLVIFGISMVFAAPIAGWITNHSSARQVPLVIGLGMQFAATFFLMVGTAAWMLVAGRCLQGLAAGLVYTAGLSLMAETVRREELGAWMGFALSGMNFGVLLSPLLAGIVYEKAGYYAVFAMGLSVIFFNCFLVITMIDKKTATKWLGKWDPQSHRSTSEGRSTDCSAKVEVEPETSQNNSSKHSDSITDAESDITLAATDVEIYGTFTPFVGEDTPLIGNRGLRKNSVFARRFPKDSILLSSPQIAAAMYSAFINSVLVTSFDAVLPLFVQRTFHWDAAAVGGIFLTLTIPSLLGPGIGALSDRFGPRIIALFGFGLCIPALAFLGIIRHNAIVDVIGLCILLVLIGMVYSHADMVSLLTLAIGTGINFFLSPLATDMSITVEKIDTEYWDVFGSAGACADTYAIFACAMGLGTVFGPIVAGVLYHNTNWAITGGALALISLSGSIPVVRTLFHLWGNVVLIGCR